MAVGDGEVFDGAMRRFRKEVVAGTAAEYVAASSPARCSAFEWATAAMSSNPTSRTARAGSATFRRSTGSANMSMVSAARGPCPRGTQQQRSSELRPCRRFFWAVRLPAACRPRRGTAQLRISAAHCGDHALRGPTRKSAVERFMQFYFLNAKAVGDLTGVFLAQLDEQLGKKGFRFALPTIRRKPKRLAGFVLDRGQLSV